MAPVVGTGGGVATDDQAPAFGNTSTRICAKLRGKAVLESLGFRAPVA
jgi:hypothetical protein